MTPDWITASAAPWGKIARRLAGACQRGLYGAIAVALCLSVAWPTAPAWALSQPPGAMAGIFGNLLAGSRPDTLGVSNGRLASCPPTPNCVSSQALSTDLDHAIAPLSVGTVGPATAMQLLSNLVQQQERVAIVEQRPDYLYAEFTSSLLGFVDDVEFWLDAEAGEIALRSASRLGQSDLGANRQRIEALRARLNEELTKATLSNLLGGGGAAPAAEPAANPTVVPPAEPVAPPEPTAPTQP